MPTFASFSKTKPQHGYKARIYLKCFLQVIDSVCEETLRSVFVFGDSFISGQSHYTQEPPPVQRQHTYLTKMGKTK